MPGSNPIKKNEGGREMTQLKVAKRNTFGGKGKNAKKRKRIEKRAAYKAHVGLQFVARTKDLRRARVPQNPHPVPMPPIDDED